jgi:aspartate aminotransferase
LPDFPALEKALTPSVKALIINTPNNPSGVVYDDETLTKLADLLRKKSAEYGHTIYLISDEPYRELVYDKNIKQPFPLNYYEETLVCYSYSKSLSLPGERIGYVAVNPAAADFKALYASVCGAGRVLGFVCAPALFQRVVAECDGLTGDLSVYKHNRDLLYNGLTECGFECVHPDGAFYLFVKTPEADASAFCARAREHYELLMVPGDDFGCAGYVRVAYCVSTDLIERSMPFFKKLAAEYGL